MPDIEYNIGRQLQKSLRELGNTYQFNELEFLTENTNDSNIRWSSETICYGLDLNQNILLAKKEYSDRKKEIVVWFFNTYPESTTIGEDQLITWEIEDIAKEFARNYGLIPDLLECLNEASNHFSNIESLVAEYDCFHVEDYKEEGHIVIRLTVGSSQETAFNEYDTFNEWILENINDDSLEHFVVSIRRKA
jgi:hypothetical protein